MLKGSNCCHSLQSMRRAAEGKSCGVYEGEEKRGCKYGSLWSHLSYLERGEDTKADLHIHTPSPYTHTQTTHTEGPTGSELASSGSICTEMSSRWIGGNERVVELILLSPHLLPPEATLLFSGLRCSTHGIRPAFPAFESSLEPSVHFFLVVSQSVQFYTNFSLEQLHYYVDLKLE